MMFVRYIPIILLIYYIMLDQLRESLSNLVANKKFLIVLVLTAIFIAAAIYTYNRYVTPRLNPEYVANKEFVQEGGEESQSQEAADLYFFYTTWCPHCKKAMPIWSKLREQIGEGRVKDTKINFIEIDCDKDTATAERFKVEGYPTIKLVKGNQVIEYDAKPDLENLNQFLTTSL